MQRNAPALPWVQPSPRAARRSEWLRSALAHHHYPDPGAENEIVVLATGIDQYLQEVFHHLANPNRDDKVSAEDFTALCAVLGFTGAEVLGRRSGAGAEGREGEDEEEFKGLCSGLPGHLSFKDFHSRLCGYFRVRAAPRGTGVRRLPVTEETELVERQIRLRCPRVRRGKCVSFDPKRDECGHVTRAAGDSESEEVAALRELVEDLRSALQGSDARCLALEVALRREGAACATTVPTPTTSITLLQGKLVPTQRIKGQLRSSGGEGARRLARRCDIKDPLLRELKLIRSSRDGQLQEAIRFNERLEEELRWAYQEVHKLQGAESALRRENTQIRRRAEEAREALSLGLQRVRLIQEQAESVPPLQARISQLEAELQRYRSCCTCIPDPTLTCSSSDAECLQRAVEGRAASDEEEDDRGRREEGRFCQMEAMKHISRSHDCRSRFQNHRVQPLLQDKNLSGTSKDSRGRCSWAGREPPKSSRACDEEQRSEDETKLEDKEKMRLSLLEDKFRDALMLLLQLRNKHVTSRELGRIVMDALDVSSRGGDGPCQVLQVADDLCKRLPSSDPLGDETGGERGGALLVPSSGRQASSVGHLLVSC
ncbi:EF-hand and coiled-coil domain-containing protein 1 [Aulostomus maculatus]